MTKGQVITFYSYKGGTGRTMALANVAFLLSKQYKVLMIDWDLEAPGLHYYFKDSLHEAKTLEKNGLIELFEEISALFLKHEEWTNEESAIQLFDNINLEGFINHVSSDHLFLITAGAFKKNYSQQVTTFQWENLFERAPWLFRRLADHLTSQYDYVLVDSHTGLNDISGICTALMPEKLVAVFTPNRQSIDGLSNVLSSSLKYRRESDDIRPLTVFPLLTRVDFQEQELFKQWRLGSKDDEISGFQSIFEELFKDAYGLDACDLTNYFDNIQIQHIAYYAYGEKIAASETPVTGRFDLGKSYEIFSEALIKSSPPWTVQDVQLKISPETQQKARRKVSIRQKSQMDVAQIQINSQRPSEVWRGMEKIRQWLMEDPEDQDIYGLLLDAVQKNRDLREQVRSLLYEMAQRGSKRAEEAILSLPSSVQDLLADADDVYYAAEYDRAIQLYRQVLKLEPENARAKDHLAKAEISRLTGESDSSLPRSAVQYYRRARSYIAARDVITAMNLLSAAIESAQAKGMKFPEAEEALSNMNNLLAADEFRQKAKLAMGRDAWKDALELYNKALALDPTNEVMKKELDTLQDLLQIETRLRNRGVSKIFLSVTQWQRTIDVAKIVLSPDNPLINSVEKELNQVRAIRFISFIVLFIGIVLSLYLNGVIAKFSPLLTLTNTPPIVLLQTDTLSTLSNTSTKTLEAMTPTPIAETPTSTPTQTLPFTPTQSTLGIGYINKATASAWKEPNGGLMGILALNQPLTLLEARDVSGSRWYRCRWEKDGTTQEGWILANNITFGPAPTSRP